MNRVIYKYHLPLTPDQVKQLEEGMTPGEKKLFNKLDIISHDRIDENGKVLSFMIGPIDEFFTIDCFLSHKKINYLKEDINYKVLMGEYEFIDTPMEEYVDEYIKRNLNVDVILDKINYSGIESLTAADRMVLESF